MPATTYIESLFETDARIIAENNTHAVLAIRIEKAALQKFIHGNRHLLAAMADLAPTLAAQPDEPCSG